MKKVVLILSVFALLAPSIVFSTHNRAGEITYKHLSGLTYEVTITTYTKTTSSQADRCELTLDYGDGDKDTVVRTNGPPQGGCPAKGEELPNDVKKNIYIGIHTYAGPGTYFITMEDPNRNDGINNIPNSVNTSFTLKSILVISPFQGANSSPVLNNPPIDNGCVFQPFLHNPAAVDPDGDSLAYQLTVCLGGNGLPITGYEYPEESMNNQGGSSAIDPIVGTYTWDSPSFIGEYNIAIRIIEYRDGVVIGEVWRDMQFTIIACNHEPPDIVPCPPICILAGDTIDSLAIVATDPDGDFVTLTATGEPLTTTVSPAYFTQDVTGDSTVTGLFYWETVCDHIRSQPYYLVVKAEDNNPEVNLVDFKTLSITIVGPPPLNLTATPQGNSIVLNWDPTTCNNAEGYKIYRRNGPYTGVIDCPCETGIPAGSGYQLVGTTTGLNNTTFTDDNGGSGLFHGQNYCYRVVACFPGGALSCASDEACAELIKDVPIITHVTVNSTDASTGSDTIKWVLPSELDTATQWSGPYYYKVYHSKGYNNPTTLIHTTPPSPFLALVDTFLLDDLLDTETNPNVYKVELYGTDSLNQQDQLVGSTHEASSIYLTSIPSDNQLTLIWQENVPWNNYAYEVYRDSLSNWILLDTADTQSYIDTGLVNGKEYCYYVRGIGTYSSTGLPDPLYNNSQEHCGIPIDTTAPCPPPNLTIQKDCETIENLLNWDNPNNTCADDVVSYNLYYTPILGGDYKLIYSTATPTDTSYLHQLAMNNSLAGCYAVTAVDSFMNESKYSNIVCVDNCPVYELPNVFTPGGDGINDLFRPFPYKYIDHIDITIFNRWGQILFTSQDPDILWDGTNQQNAKANPSGVYYYVCDVYEIRLTGLQQRTLKGYVQMLREGNLIPNY